MAKVLVVGGGGREQALAWKLVQSSSVTTVYVAPGNGGSAGSVKNVSIGFTDTEALVAFAKDNSIDLCVIGQETASEAGVVDAFRENGLAVFGPTKQSVRIETSKVFSKDMMASERIPTATYKHFTDPRAARTYANSRSLPVVIKADGLATGKGVIIAENTQAVDEAIDTIMVKQAFGSAGNIVIVEDFLKGQELSMHALSDGTVSVVFPPSQDHKQIFAGDRGPNTGGMGAYAPLDWVSNKVLGEIKETVIEPALSGLKKRGSTFVGCLYPGLMLDGSDVKVLEFNARFGDPEAQVYMRLLEGDLYEILLACVHGRLDPNLVSWRSGYGVCVVLASAGYPGEYQKGLLIDGIAEAEALDKDIVVFHAGTKRNENGQLVTAGGRVLNVTAIGSTLEQALRKAYKAVQLIHFEGMQYREDIGQRPN